MQINQICPKSEKCPIFVGGVLQRKESESIYRALFYTADKEKYTTCKRYIVSNNTGLDVPTDILPNCFKSVEEIEEIMRESVK